MRLNDRGMLALLDAVLFTVVIMLAMTILMSSESPPPQESVDASGTLDSLLSAEVRMSDFVPEGDGSLVRISDLCALYVSERADGLGDYLEETVDVLVGGRPYLLELGFGDLETEFGECRGTPLSTAESFVETTTGGTLSARLSVFPHEPYFSVRLARSMHIGTMSLPRILPRLPLAHPVSLNSLASSLTMSLVKIAIGTGSPLWSSSTQGVQWSQVRTTTRSSGMLSLM